MSPAKRASAPARNGASPPPESPSPRRTRRAPGHIQELILQAAQRSFAEKGYARSTTREIAARADVAETLLFRNFGSKANLFGEAVLRPMADFLRRWVDISADDTNLEISAELQEEFVDTLYRAAKANKGLLLTYFATSFFEPEVLDAHEAGARVQQALNDLSDALSERLVRLGVDTTDMQVGISARATVGMVLAAALFDDWLMPSGKNRPRHDVLMHELARQILYGGFNLRPPGHGPSTPHKKAARKR